MYLLLSYAIVVGYSYPAWHSWVYMQNKWVNNHIRETRSQTKMCNLCKITDIFIHIVEDPKHRSRSWWRTTYNRTELQHWYITIFQMSILRRKYILKLLKYLHQRRLCSSQFHFGLSYIRNIHVTNYKTHAVLLLCFNIIKLRELT